jgi:Uma2 family endonuclease
LPLHRITVVDYERIGASGALDSARVELIDGYMVDKMPKKPAQIYATKATYQALDSRLPPGWTWQKEEPVRIPDFDEPEPDVSVLRGSGADYRDCLPTPDDVAMLVEVSETSLRQDRGEKRAVYARAGIPVYWIVNLVDRQIEVYTRPVKEGRYRSRKDYKPGQHVPVVIDGRPLAPIAVDDILP